MARFLSAPFASRTAPAAAPAHPPPVPLLLLRHGPVASRQLATLRADPRVALMESSGWSAEALVLGQRVAATLIATAGDPLRALAYAVTAGARGTVVLLVTSRYFRGRAVVLEAGAAACYQLPLDRADVDALLGRLSPAPRVAHTDSTLRLTLDPIAREVRYRDRAVRLSQREFAVLHCLSVSDGRPVDADELLRVVWGTAPVATRPRQILDVYVCQLRKKLETLGLVDAIATVRRYGYALGHAAR